MCRVVAYSSTATISNLNHTHCTHTHIPIQCIRASTTAQQPRLYSTSSTGLFLCENCIVSTTQTTRPNPDSACTTDIHTHTQPKKADAFLWVGCCTTLDILVYIVCDVILSPFLYCADQSERVYWLYIYILPSVRKENATIFSSLFEWALLKSSCRKHCCENADILNL